MTKIIGLTGGIGSGKSTVARYLSSKNIPVYIADDEAHKILNSKTVVSKLTKLFGNQIIENDAINRKILANIVFNEPDKLAELNAIIHPLVKKHFAAWLKTKSKYNFVIKESALLFETGSNESCDFIVVITAPLEDRIKRTMQRDNISREQVIMRINNQMSDEDKIKKSDFVIQNNILDETYTQIENLLKKLK